MRDVDILALNFVSSHIPLSGATRSRSALMLCHCPGGVEEKGIWNWNWWNIQLGMRCCANLSPNAWHRQRKSETPNMVPTFERLTWVTWLKCTAVLISWTFVKRRNMWRAGAHTLHVRGSEMESPSPPNEQAHTHFMSGKRDGDSLSHCCLR